MPIATASISLEEAQAVLDAAISAARAREVKATLVILDAAGDLILVARMDGAWPGAFDLALAKANVARGFGAPSGHFTSLVQPGAPLYGVGAIKSGKYLPLPGGHPILEHGSVLGALGVSGGSPDQDAANSANTLEEQARDRSCLLVVAHPRLDRSAVNAPLVEAARMAAPVEIHDLYETYPDYQIDIAAEQARLVRHDVIGLQFPFFWYSVPALLKEWLDLVWLHGFAYGGKSPKLAGKRLFCAVSTGGDAASYAPGGHNGYAVHEFIRPLERTAALCRMEWLSPHVLHDAPLMQGQRLDEACAGYGAYIQAAVGPSRR